MGDRGARNAGLEHAPTTVDESVCKCWSESEDRNGVLSHAAGMVKVIDEATRDKWSGLHAR
jgi:hypothetical protein